MLIKHRYIVAVIVLFFFSYSKTYGQSFNSVIIADSNQVLEIIPEFNDGNFIFSAKPSNNELSLSLHQHFIDSLVTKSDEELVSISFIPESKGGASLTGVILPSSTNIKYSLKKIFQSDDPKDWTGGVTVIVGTNGYEYVLGCSLYFHQGDLVKAPDIIK